MRAVFLYGKDNNKKALIQSVNIRVYHSSFDFRRSLKLDISREGWDFKNNTIIDLSKGSRTNEENKYLQGLKDTLNSIEQTFNKEFLNLKLSNKLKSLNKESWNEWCEITLNKGLGINEEITQEIPLLLDIYEEFIRIKSNDRASNTLKGYRSNLKVLRSFMDYNLFILETDYNTQEIEKWRVWYTNQYGRNKKKEYKFNEVDLSFYRSLREWNKLKGNNDNYFYKIISNLKAVITYFNSIDSDIYKPHKNISHPDFKALKLVSNHSFLDIDELNLAFNYKGLKSLENVSSLAKILYYGCLRYNELEQEIRLINEENLKIYKRTIENIEVEYWDIYQKKEDYSKHIPISPVLKKLLTEEIPHIISMTNFNKYIKQLINEVSIQKEYKISSHTFRRSFITNMVNQGYSESSIMEYSGHKDEKSFRTYCQRNNIKIKILNPIYLG